MARDARSHKPQVHGLPLDGARAEIEWQAPSSTDVLARLLLALFDEDDLKEIFGE